MSIVWVLNNGDYEVSSLDHFRCIEKKGIGYTTTGSVPTNYWNVSYIQTTNIDFTGQIMTPIGISGTDIFTGSYNGQNFEIQNWQNDQSFAVANSVYSSQGIFGNIDNSTSILKNIKITGLVKVAGYHNCSILCGGINNGKITNININLSLGSIINSAGNNHGSIVGGGYGITVEKIRVTGYLTINAAAVIGGVIGYITSTGPSIIRDIIISTIGDFTQTGGYAGGIIAYSASTTTTINGLINEITGNITSSGSYYIGGIVGRAVSPIYSCINRMKGNLSGTDQVGGIVGNTNATVEDNMNIMEGNITGITTTTYCGGIGYSSLFSHKRNLVAMKGDTPAIICSTLTTTTSVLNNVFSNRFGMTVASVVNITPSATNGTYILLNSYPTTELTVTSSSGINKTWNSYKYLPISSYSYTNILGTPSQIITSDTTNLPEVNWILNGSLYEVSSILHLRCIASMGIGINLTGSPPSNYLTSSYIQTVNIDCTGYTMTPIGISINYYFTGNYNGQNYEIQNWQNDQTSTSDFQGIFGYIDNLSSVFKNISITGLIKLMGVNQCGILCGRFTRGQINNINLNLSNGSIMTVTGANNGGLLGFASSIVEKVRIKGYLTINGGSTGSSIGGVIGGVTSTYISTIRDIIISTIGDITGVSTIGGMIGIINRSDSPVYGLINEIQGNIIGTSSSIGGIIGTSVCAIYLCINRMKGNISGTIYIGGIVGGCSGSIEDNMNIMEGNIVYTTITNTGGILGYTVTVSQSIKRNLVAMKGNTPSGICYTYGTTTTNIVNNVYSNRFGMTINTAIITAYTLNNGTNITLSSYPTTELTVTSISGVNKTWNSYKYLPILTYYYTDILGIFQIITSDTTLLPEVNWIFNGSTYEVSSILHLRCIASMGVGFNITGNPPSNYLTVSYIQTTNIDCIDYAGYMTPLGVSINYSFNGNYNGQNFEIQNWQNNQSITINFQGIFGYVNNSTTIIKNISITGLTKVKGLAYCGILCGCIINSKVNNINTNLSSNSIVSCTDNNNGGIIGIADTCTIEKIRVKGYLTVTVTATNIGGIIGYVSGTCIIRDIILSTIGNITGNSTGIGGIIGNIGSPTTTTIYGLINEMQGNITGTSMVGGIIGSGYASVYSTINRMKGNITGTTAVGGIIGNTTTSIEDNINVMEGNIFYTTITNTGGIVGSATGTNQSIKRNVVAMKGNTPSGICYTYGTGTTNIVNNIFSNRFGMTIFGSITTTPTLNNGTYITLDNYPLTELTTTGYIKYWSFVKYIPIWSYTYTDILSTSQTILSDELPVVTWVLTNGNYEVSSLYHLICIASRGVGFTTNGSIPSNYFTVSYIQTINIDCNGYIMTPIGDLTNQFTGNYNGQNYEIQNWQNNQSTTSDSQGIFGYIYNSSSIIKNISITGLIKVKGNNYCGILCSYFLGKVNNINLNLSQNSIVTGVGYVGGVIGLAYTPSYIEKIRVKGYLTLTDTGGQCGGIIGRGVGDIFLKDLIISTIGNFTATDSIGGIIGYSGGTSSTYYGLINEMQGNMTATSTTVGGIIGVGNTSIYSCTNRMKGNLSGADYVGGIVGSILNSIEDCINIMEGNISSITTTTYCGGIGYTSMATPSIKRNVIAMKGNTPAGICMTIVTPTTNVSNNVFSNKFGMTINNVVTTTSTTNNGTYVTLNSYPTTELTTTGYIKYWNSVKGIPIWSYTYTDILSTSQIINSDELPNVTWVLNNGNYEVSSLNHLMCIASRGVGFTTFGSIPSNYLTVSYIQTVNIDCISYAGYMTPIGDSTNQFTGSYNGQNFEIQNWQNNQSSTSTFQGIFGCINNSTSIIKNISITGLIKVKSSGNSGMLCGYFLGKMNNINLNLSQNSINSSNGAYNGSIIGNFTGGTIEKIRVKGYLTISAAGGFSAGIIGIISGTGYIQDIILSTVGDILGYENVTGGILGYVNTSTMTIGGLINEMQGNITSTNINVGGVVGVGGNVYACMNRMKGNITGLDDVGGIVGNCTGAVEDNINVMEGNIISTSGIVNIGGILGYTVTANQSIKRNVIAMKGNCPAGICLTYGTGTTNIVNNVFSNKFGMTINTAVTSTSTTNNGTYVTLGSYPTTELTTTGYIKYWDSVKGIPYWTYTYLNIFGFSQTLSSYMFSYYGAHLDIVNTNNQGLSNTVLGDIVLNSIDLIEKINFGCGTNTIPKMTLMYNNIGIGNTQPIYTFDMNTTDAIKISSGSTTDRPITSNIGMIRYNTTTSKYECFTNNSWSNILISNSNSTLSLNNSFTSNALDITGTANISGNLYINSKIGIGSTNPLYTLDINGITNSTNMYIGSNLCVSNSNNLYKLDITGNVSISNNLYIQSGLVGIGTIKPTYTLDIGGSMNISSNLFITEKIGLGYNNVSIIDGSSNNYNLSSYISGSTPIVTNIIPNTATNNVAFIHNEAISLNGNYFYIQKSQLQLNWQTNAAFTVESWIYLNSYGSFDGNTDIPRFVGSASPTGGDNTWSFGNTSSGYLCLYYYNSALSYLKGIKTQLSLNTWYHVAFTVSGTTISLWINGVLEISSTLTGTIISFASYLMIGRYNNNSPNLYFRDLRINKNCLYTANFIPPTYISSTKDTNTLLLIQTSPIYNVNINGSLNSTSINNLQSYNIQDFEYPPYSMTANTTVFSDGQYIASCSSKYIDSTAYDAWYAFNKTYSADFWHSQTYYSSTTGISSGGSSTTNIDGSGTYSGEWLQLQLPKSILLTKYRLYNRTGAGTQFPCGFKLFGSTTGINWFTLDTQDNIFMGSSYYNQTPFVSRDGYITFYIKNNSNLYNYYRLSVNKSYPYIGNTVTVIGELVLYGKDSTSSQLNSSILKTIYTNDLNVGIGTTNIQGKLHIYNPNPTEETLILTNGGSSTEFNKPQIRFSSNGTTDNSHFIGTRHNTIPAGNCIDFYCCNGNLANSINVGTTLVMTLEGSGYVGLGITNPSYQLDLSTDSARKGVSGTWLGGSDKRIKENIEIADYTMCYNVLSNLDLKYFKWTDTIEQYRNVFDRHKLGWIADDVELYLPKAVIIENERYGLKNFKNLNADQIYTNMYGTIKKLIKDIDKIKEENKNIEFQIQQLF